jgi:uncharacterized membrane protein
MKTSFKENKKLLLWNKINMALGILLLGSALFGLFRKPFYLKTTIIFIILGSTILLSAYLNRKRIMAELEGKTIADERSRRVGERAGFYTFFLLIASLLVSGLANTIFSLGLEYTLTVNVILFGSVFTWIIIGYYLDKKGEV